jgi:hypothetical protein
MHQSANSFDDLFDHKNLIGPRSDEQPGAPQRDQREDEVTYFDPIWPVLDNSQSPPDLNFDVNAIPSMIEAFNPTTCLHPFMKNGA